MLRTMSRVFGTWSTSSPTSCRSGRRASRACSYGCKPDPTVHEDAGSQVAGDPCTEDLEDRCRRKKPSAPAPEIPTESEWYLVDAKWMERCRQYVSHGGEPPGPISNHRIVDDNGNLLVGAEHRRDYRGVHADTWHSMQRAYGGGPPIRRLCVNAYTPALEANSKQTPARFSRHRENSMDNALGHSQAHSSKSTSRTPRNVNFDAHFQHKMHLKMGSRSRRSSRHGRDKWFGSCNEDAPVQAYVPRTCATVLPQPYDGSCLFHALSCALRDGTSARKLRLEICEYIRKHPDLSISNLALEDWIRYDSGIAVDEYTSNLQAGAWGGAIEIEVFVHMRNVDVHVYVRCSGGFRRVCAFEGELCKQPVIHVLYRNRKHYEVLEISKSCAA